MPRDPRRPPSKPSSRATAAPPSGCSQQVRLLHVLHRPAIRAGDASIRRERTGNVKVAGPDLRRRGVKWREYTQRQRYRAAVVSKIIQQRKATSHRRPPVSEHIPGKPKPRAQVPERWVPEWRPSRRRCIGEDNYV